MKKLFNNIFAVSSIVFIISLINCEKHPLNPNYSGQSSILVSVEDRNGNPLEGLSVIVYPDSIDLITDKNGHVLFENLPKENYYVIVNHRNISQSFQFVNLKGNKTTEVKFIVDDKIDINVRVKDSDGQPINDVQVSTFPITTSVTTDENGYAIFKDIPYRPYTYVVSRFNYSIYFQIKKIVVKSGEIQDIEIVIGSQAPFVKILSPRNIEYYNVSDIHFSCEGYDFEDGTLPESSLIWYSSIDGELGTGNEFSMDHLSVGYHTIKLVCTDSENNQTERTIPLNLHYYEEDSYFPFPQGGTWRYDHSIPEFSFVDEYGDYQYWQLGKFEVSMQNLNSRNSFIRYSIQTEFGLRTFHYNVIDIFETDTENIYVAQTIERLSVWEGNIISGEPIEQMEIKSVYSPRYLLIKNHVEPLPSNSYSSSVSAEVEWNYDNELFDKKSFTETVDIDTFVEIGEDEEIETPVGYFNTSTFTVYQGDSERKWWLAKGIGLVKLEYNTFDFTQTAFLSDTNISEFSTQNGSQKLPGQAPGKYFPPARVFESPSNTPERMLEISRMLRNICPR